MTRPIGITIVIIYTILSGLNEIWVGITGNWMGILAKSLEPSLATVVVGAFYCLAGISLLLTGKKWGAVLSLIFTGAEVLGRFFLVMTGVAPSRGPDLAKIIVGAVIAVCVMIYIGWQYFWKPTSN
jgi:Na+-translocating ferredoxin:NAD+ oxidoreductase RnfD subunit